MQAAVRLCRAIDRDVATSHLGKQASIVVPIAVVLMPFPCATYTRFLEHKLVMIMIDFFPKY